MGTSLITWPFHFQPERKKRTKVAKVYRCSDCQETFSKAKILEWHLDNVHGAWILYGAKVIVNPE